ncbi:DUF4129 domain-containing transglutaminase family protein [Falsibacillus pallidus]|uniref:Uncharacterized protein DUF4129 n=1 Tax=Falsibacillus pallidus TaxID=493781 RepID=A0A370G262_9BACI|nr:transglutaminase domain-containing protein [Falsibacillus pallidus]RDI37957.1 uncharacterized protein DUF4129 [Falsibacillus pallidus]
MSQGLNVKGVYGAVLYFLGFLLLWEWIRPLEQLTMTGEIQRFLVFIILCLVLSFFSVHWAISSIIKVVYLLFTLHLIFFEGPLMELQWLKYFFGDLSHNLSLIVHQDWYGLSDLFRSLLFFVLLWLMAYLMHYWLMVRKKIFIFYFLTIIYITILDTFSPYKADHAIIRIIVVGFILLGILFFNRLTEREGIEEQGLQMRKWILPLAIMVGGSAVAAYAAPKADPIWPDPVPYLKSYAEGAGTGPGGVAKIGYGTDDTQLGGPFNGDNTIVFTAEDTTKHYWKIETKDQYTGKGWVLSDAPNEEKVIGPGEQVPDVNPSVSADSPDETAKLSFNLPYEFIVQPAGLLQINGQQNDEYHLNTASEKWVPYRKGKPYEIEKYTLDYKEPSYSMKAMRGTTGEHVEADILKRYTQLPDTVPLRVKELAKSIIEGKDNWFDQAKAIEGYFKNPGFIYDQSDVAVPGKNQDYVDQFLFDTQKGYCDNFSTSMIVLLRSVGIPSRWVKGYSDGQFKFSKTGNFKVYEVTNNDAHSWVEVYFPNVGWVPFEPTKGFDGNINYKYDLNVDKSTTPPPVKKPETPEKKPAKDLGKETTVKNTDRFSFIDMWNDIVSFWKNSWGWILLGAVMLGIISWIFYKARGRWIPYFLLIKYKRKHGDDTFEKAYLSLLKQLDRSGLKMDDGQTLRGYAKYIDSFFSTREMSRLTAIYERVLYRREKDAANWDETRKLWENLIKKTTG